MSKVFITGMGMISAIGNSVAENRNALLQGECGIKKISNLPSRYAGQLPFGEILLSTDTLREILNADDAGLTRTTLLALYAVKEAIADSRLTPTQISSFDTALVGATTVGGMCLMDEFYKDVNRRSDGSVFLSSYDGASISQYLQTCYNLKGIVNTINTACSSSANAIMYGARLIKNGLARRAIVGGVDSLSKYTVNGFNSLRILSPEICTPFDENRQGLNLGEGAAYLILEKEEDIAGKKVYATLTGYGNSNDAFHASSLSEEGDGPYLAMKGALVSAGLNPDEIDFINAHGTGTENNDAVESRAILRLFGTAPAFASTKSNTGHTLGASGAIEATYSILNIIHQEIYAGLHFSRPISGTGLQPVTNYKKSDVDHVMSNSFGFGGNCTSLIFSKA
ncbi:beta-ketoacyl-[acyl-carrier-protein] synthase family protein [Flavitalea flava]